MPAPTNLGFETAGASAGLAASWTINFVSSAREIGGFFAGENLAAQSEVLSLAPWTTLGASVVDDAVSSWDGLEIGGELVDTMANGIHQVSQSIAIATGDAFTFEAEAKANTCSFVILSSSNGLRYACFNLAAGTIGTSSGVTAHMTALGNGWYRCRIDDAISSGATYAISAAQVDNDSVYTGTGTTAIFVTRVRVLHTALAGDAAVVYTPGGTFAPAPYIRTDDTPTQLYAPFEDFDPVWFTDGYAQTFALGRLIAAVFDDIHGYVGEIVEDFEEAWGNNELFIGDINEAATPAMFDAGAVAYDGFSSWFVGAYLLAFVGVGTDLEAALFDSGANAYEGFTAWATGYKTAFVGIGTDLAQGLFAGSWGADIAETFERILTPLTFTAGAVDTSLDTITIASHNLSGDEPVVLSNPDTLPGGTAAAVTYYVGFVSSSVFKLKVAPGAGAFVDLTSGGSGTTTISGSDLSFWPYPPISSW